MSRDYFPDEAELGETDSFESEMEVSFWGSSLADDVAGWDADVSDLRVSDARVVGEDGNEDIKLAVTGDVTKVEPPEWVSDMGPVEEEASPDRFTIPSWVGPIIGVAIPIMVTFAVLAYIPAFEITATSQTSPFNPTVPGLLVDLSVAAFTAVLVLLALIYGPGNARGWN